MSQIKWGLDYIKGSNYKKFFKNLENYQRQQRLHDEKLSFKIKTFCNSYQEPCITTLFVIAKNRNYANAH